MFTIRHNPFDADTSRFALLVEGADEANDDGGGNGADRAGGDGTAFEQFARTLETLNHGNSALGGKLDELIGVVRDGAAGAGDGDDEPAPDLTTEQLEGMSRADLVAFITGTMARSFDDRLKEALQPIVNAIAAQQTTTATNDVKGQIDKLASDVKDFHDWKGDMAELAKVHTTLNIRQLYNLARAENPSKASELDKKNAPAPKSSAPKWGGLSPSGGPLTAKALADAGATTGKDATVSALQEVAERHPVLAGLLNS